MAGGYGDETAQSLDSADTTRMEVVELHGGHVCTVLRETIRERTERDKQGKDREREERETKREREREKRERQTGRG